MLRPILYTPICVFLFTMLSLANAQDIKIHYLGHSSFIIGVGDDYSILCDYGKQNAWKEYGWNSPIYDIGEFIPDFVYYSHTHEDHYDPDRLNFKSKLLIEDDKIDFSIIKTSENILNTKSNQSILMNLSNKTVLFLGDCQANIIYIDSLSNKKFIQDNIPKNLDIVFVPIESQKKFISELVKFILMIEPKVVIPMHYWSLEYKTDFFKYLAQNKEMSDVFHIINQNGPVFIFPNTQMSDKINVINLDPEKFNYFK